MSKEKMAGWNKLPAELRLNIMEIVAQERGSRYATISYEWLGVYEKRNFKHLKLTQHFLEKFGRLNDRQRSLVQHIWLCIRPQASIERNFCGILFTESENTTPMDDLNRIREAIEKFSSILSTWEADGRPGISVDLCAYYPDDLHSFPGDYFDADAQTSRAGDYTGSSCPLGTSKADDNYVYGTDMQFEVHPKVNVVTSLVVRRQLRCRFTPDSFSRLLRRLPRLEYLCYELRNRKDLSSALSFEPGSEAIIFKQELLPKLKRLTMFEEPESYFSLIVGSILPWPDRLPDPSVDAALANFSVSLEQLSASFFMEASGFFSACQANWAWRSLHSLALTSRLFNPKADAGEINGVLYAAGKAAHHMPQLQTMEIWNGNSGSSCVFRYDVTENSATLTLWRSWDLDLEARVVQIWEDVARMYDHGTLVVNVGLVSVDRILSATDDIGHLKLKQHVLHPVSLRQINREGRSPATVFANIGNDIGSFI